MTTSTTSTTPPTLTEQASEQTIQTEQKRPRDLDNWAHSASPVFHAMNMPSGALNQVEGKEVTGPLRGFGPLWQKTYWVALPTSLVSARDLVSAWKANFPSFWPKGNRFYAPLTGIAPGEVALINMDVPGGMKLSTGVMVLYSDEEQFSFITPEGHMLAGWITFSGYEKAGQTIAQVQVLVRAPDPLMELLLRFGGYAQEDKFWKQTLGSVARHFGIEIEASMRRVCVDRRIQWSQARNIRHNLIMRSTFYFLAAPARWARNRKAR
jgi:hypothetical protein